MTTHSPPELTGSPVASIWVKFWRYGIQDIAPHFKNVVIVGGGYIYIII